MKSTRSLLPILAAASAALALQAHVVRADESTPTTSEDTALGTVGEIFLKGSIDGKHMFMVLGMDKALDASSDIAQWAIDKDGLKEDGQELADDLKEVGEDATEFDDAFRNGVKFSKEGAEVLKDNAPKIWRAPWRSLKKIPGAYRVNFDRAQDAYYGSKHASVGALKYAGWAAWANIEGAYYLVVEAPVKMVGEILFNTAVATGTALGVPGAIAFKGLEIAWDATETALHSAWVGTKIVLRATAGLIATIATVSYSLLTTGTAELLAGIAYVGVMSYRGGRFLLVELPRKRRFPISVSRETRLDYDQQLAAATALSDATRSLNLPEVGRILVLEQISKYKSTFKIGDVDSEIGELAVLTVKVKKQKVVLELELTRNYVRFLRSLPNLKGASRKEARESLESRFQTILDNLPVEGAHSLLSDAA